MLKHTPRIVVGLLVAILLVSISQCTTIGEKLVEKPHVELKQVSVSEVNTSGATLGFFIEVENPNPFALKVDSLRYEIEIEAKPLGRGELAQPAEVAAKGKTTVEIKLPVLYKDLFARLLDFIQKKNCHYHLKGEAKFGLLTVPVDAVGEFKLGG